MAAYLRNVICLCSTERCTLLAYRTGIIAESKRYVRGLRRKPVQVLYPKEETGQIIKSAETNTQREPRGKPAPTTERYELRKSVTTKKDVQSAVMAAGHGTVGNDEAEGLRFERAFPGDKRLARLVSVARSRTFREHQGKILLEGRRLICDALDAGAIPQTVFFSTVDRLRELPLEKLRRATLVKVKFEEIKIWSDLVAPQGVIAIFSRPDPSRLNFASKGCSLPLSLICDNIRDPGNLGTMLRCAAAAGCHNALLTKGCVDAWEPKVLRAAMGAHFRLPIYPNMDWKCIENHLPNPVTVHVADSCCSADTSLETEANVSHKPSKAGDYGWVSTRPNQKNMRYEESDSDSESDSDDEGLSLSSVDTKLYHDSWTQSPSPTALVIGGETHGLSLQALQLAEKTNGYRLFIPIAPGVESLNSAMAASILLFEGRKQLLKLPQTSSKKLQTKPGRQSS
ncbi:rRNA methyltransferase 3A, mitochondrial [Pholidichthys leucotaenia]